MAPPKWLRMTQNGQFYPIHNFSNLYQPQMIGSGGVGGVNYQMQIVSTKLPNENLQTYQLQMIDSREGGKLPNTNCGHQTTNCNSINHKHYFTCKALKMKSQFTFGSLPPWKRSFVVPNLLK